MQIFRENSMTNEGFNDEGNVPVPVADDLSYTMPDAPYEEIDERKHTYEALSGHDNETSYQKIIENQNADHIQNKSVCVLYLSSKLL